MLRRVAMTDAPSLRFLIAEDESGFRLAIETQLKNEFPASTFLFARTEESFLGLVDDLESEPPDVFITDMRLPSTTGSLTYVGARCIRELRNRPKFADLPVVILSIVPWMAIRAELTGVNLDEVHYLEKPWEYVKLTAAIRSFLAARNRLAEPKSKSVASRIWGAIEAKVGVGGIKVDIKKIFGKADQ
jgi:CheY-like chemotaxis protein